MAFRTAYVAGLLSASLWIGFGQAIAKRPNVIVIMADDLGYGDVSCYGATALQTPHIDRLAAEGLRFTSGYCSASTCTPTRFSMLTGTYAFRGKRTGIAPPNSPAIIKPGTETVASILQRAGYATAVIGKWHLGLGGPEGPQWNGALKPGPLEIGFDTCFLLPTTNDRVPQVYVQDHRVPNLDPTDPLWVGDKKPSPDHPDRVNPSGYSKDELVPRPQLDNSQRHQPNQGFIPVDMPLVFVTKIWPTNGSKNQFSSSNNIKRNPSFCSFRRMTFTCRGCLTSDSKGRPRSDFAVTRSFSLTGVSEN